MTNGNNQPKRKAIAPLIIILAVSLVSAGAIGFGSMASSGSGSSSTSTQQQSSTSADASSSSASSESSSASSASGTTENAVIGEYAISSQSRDEDRAKNLAKACETLNGTVIQPGETISLNEILGDLQTATGYYVASESADGHTGAVRGGGVNQIAAALYVAAVKANLDIVERHAHDEACDYAPAGFDAELEYGKKDLKIKNTSDVPVSISAKAQGQIVQVQVFGKPLDGKTYDITATLVQENGNNTYTIETYKVEYVDGILKSTEKLYTDSYGSNESGFITQQGAVSASK